MKKQIIYCEFIPRIFAMTLDLIILCVITLPMNLVSYYVFLYFGETFLTILLLNLVNVSLMGVYFVSFWWKFGATPSKMLLRMKIVDSDSLGAPSLYQLVKRFLSYFTAVIGVWFMVFSKRRMAIHDRIANTVVIKS